MLVPVLLLSFLALVRSTPIYVQGHYEFDDTDVPMLDGRIVGGVAVDISSYPYQLSLHYNQRHICGGAIISNTWTVTAAHCVSGSSAASLRYRAGSTQHASGGTLHQVAAGSVHGSYDSRTLDYDIAVLRVSTAFSLGSTGIQRINLLSSGTTPSTGSVAWVSGWGTTSSGSSSVPAALRAVDVPIVSQSSCASSYGSSAVTARMICAGYANGGRDACQGDSGGPLVVGSTLVGIVSWGRGCAAAGYPGVYSHVGSLRAWIQQASGI